MSRVAIDPSLSAREAAARYGVSYSTIYKWADETGHTFPDKRQKPRPANFSLPVNITLSEACLEYSIGEKTMRKWAHEIGHVFAETGKRIAYREKVSTMKPMEAVEYLLEVLERLDPDDSSREVLAIRAHGFTQREAAFLLLMRRPYVQKDTALSRISVDRDLPITARSLSKFICTLRKKLKPFPVTILTEPEVGYRIVRAQGFVFPWEKQNSPGY